MVDKQKIMDAFITNFTYSHRAIIDVDDNGMVNVSRCADIKLSELKAHSKLPVKFATITGNLSVSNNMLESLEGCPKHVPGYFDCSNTLIKNLKGGPEVVGNWSSSNNWYDARFLPTHPLTSLEGLAEQIGGTLYLSYTTHLPLLRICLSEKKSVKFTDAISDQIDNYPAKYKDADLDDHIKYRHPHLSDLENLFNQPDHQGASGVLRMVSAMSDLESEWGAGSLGDNASL